MTDFLESLGISPAKLVFGAWGALTGLLIAPIRDWKEGLLMVSCGLACAFTLPEVVYDFWPYQEKYKPGVIFILGLTGMFLVQRVYAAVKGAIRAIQLTGPGQRGIRKDDA